MAFSNIFINKFKFTFDIDARFALTKIYNFFALLQIYDVMPAAAGRSIRDPFFRNQRPRKHTPAPFQPLRGKKKTHAQTDGHTTPPN